MLILGIVSMLPFPAIQLLAFPYSGACVETITVQQPFNLAVRPAGSKEFQRRFLISFINLHEIFTIGYQPHLQNRQNAHNSNMDVNQVFGVFPR